MKNFILILIFGVTLLNIFIINAFTLKGQKAKDACSDKQCKNSGKCKLVSDDSNRFLCECTKGFYGEKCENQDPCHKKNPCKNKGSCIFDQYKPTKFTCNCTKDFYGEFCEEKDACYKNPCQHNGVCILDPSNFKQFSCNCTKGYYGDKCDKEDGCNKKPCKNGGVCVVDEKNPTKFDCICPSGRVGEKCEKVDECAKKPCQNGGTCKLNAKLKAECICPNGWTSTNCEKRNCPIIQYETSKSAFVGPLKINIDTSVKASFDQFNILAKLCKVKILQGLSFHDGSRSFPNSEPHYIGRALTFTLLDENKNLLCNDFCLAKTPIPVQPASCFIDHVVLQGWKFNGESGQIYDDIFNRNLSVYNNLLETVKVGCKDKKLGSFY